SDAPALGLSAPNIDLPIVGDCKSVLQQLCEVVDAKTADRFQAWRQKLADGEVKKRLRAGGNYPTDGDIHPLRLCEEVTNFMQREALLGRRAGDPQRPDKSDQAPAPNPHRSTHRRRELPRGFLPRGFSGACLRAPPRTCAWQHPKTLNNFGRQSTSTFVP